MTKTAQAAAVEQSAPDIHQLLRQIGSMTAMNQALKQQRDEANNKCADFMAETVILNQQIAALKEDIARANERAAAMPAAIGGEAAALTLQ